MRITLPTALSDDLVEVETSKPDAILDRAEAKTGRLRKAGVLIEHAGELRRTIGRGMNERAAEGAGSRIDGELQGCGVRARYHHHVERRPSGRLHDLRRKPAAFDGQGDVARAGREIERRETSCAGRVVCAAQCESGRETLRVIFGRGRWFDPADAAVAIAPGPRAKAHGSGETAFARVNRRRVEQKLVVAAGAAVQSPADTQPRAIGQLSDRPHRPGLAHLHRRVARPRRQRRTGFRRFEQEGMAPHFIRRIARSVGRVPGHEALPGDRPADEIRAQPIATGQRIGLQIERNRPRTARVPRSVQLPAKCKPHSVPIEPAGECASARQLQRHEVSVADDGTENAGLPSVDLRVRSANDFDRQAPVTRVAVKEDVPSAGSGSFFSRR